MESMTLAPLQRTASERGSPNPTSTNDRLSSMPASEDARRLAEGRKQHPCDGQRERGEATKTGELARSRPDGGRWWRSTTQDDVLEAFKYDDTWARGSPMAPSGNLNASFQQGEGGIGAWEASATSRVKTACEATAVGTSRETKLETPSRETPCASPLPSPSRERYLGDHQAVSLQPLQHPPLNEVAEVNGVVLSHPSSMVAEHGSEEAAIGVGIEVSSGDGKEFAVGARREDVVLGEHDKGGASTREDTLWSRLRKQKEADEAAARKEAMRAKKMRAEMVLEVL